MSLPVFNEQNLSGTYQDNIPSNNGAELKK